MSAVELSADKTRQSDPRAAKVTVTKLRAMKERGEKITMVTAYDYSTARIADAAGVDTILVGNSLGQVVLGYD